MIGQQVRVMRCFETFDLVEELWDSGDEELPDGDPRRKFNVEVYRSKSGDYIDTRRRGRRPGRVKTIARLKIHAEKTGPTNSVCSIGRSEVDGRWYGWSHRAMLGFGPGDKIFDPEWGMCSACRQCNESMCEGGLCAQLDSMPFRERGGRDIVTDDDAKVAATAFAEDVG